MPGTLTLARANELLDILVSENDGKTAPELLELLHGISSPDNYIALELKRKLFMMTEDFESSFERYLSGVGVQVQARSASVSS